MREALRVEEPTKVANVDLRILEEIFRFEDHAAQPSKLSIQVNL